jgi:hypothetical protein
MSPPEARCEDSRPCANCAKSSEDCVLTQPASPLYIDSDYVRMFEDRLAELESLESQPTSEYPDRTNTSVHDKSHHGISSAGGPMSNGFAAGASLTLRSTVRRRPSALSETARVHMLDTDSDNESDLHSLLVGLIASPLAEDSPETQHSIGGQSPGTRTAETTLPPDLAENLLDAYHE